MSDSLQSLRKRLDDVDLRLIETLAERQRGVADVAAVKADPGLSAQLLRTWLNENDR